jgi:hypothetical protein
MINIDPAERKKLQDWLDACRENAARELAGLMARGAAAQAESFTRCTTAEIKHE